jgi:hypothetical protein
VFSSTIKAAERSQRLLSFISESCFSMLYESIEGIHDMRSVFFRELLYSDDFIKDGFIQFNIGVADQVIQRHAEGVGNFSGNVYGRRGFLAFIPAEHIRVYADLLGEFCLRGLMFFSDAADAASNTHNRCI